MNRTRPLLLALCLAAPFVGSAVAVADDGPGCHGNNEAECRPDPNEHGADCDEHGQHDESNDDHCATTTTAATPLTTASTAAPTTTTAAPTTTTLALTPFVPATTTTTRPAAVLGTKLERLPATGVPIAFLTVCALLAIGMGLALRYADKLED